MDPSNIEQVPPAQTPNPEAGSGMELKVDTTYYFEWVIFQVEDTLFNVPKHAFQVAGTPFEAMFTLPSNGPVEGRSRDNPIILGDVSKTFFKGFLRFLYPLKGVVPTEEECLGALGLATRWGFEEIREQAIEAETGVIREKGAVEAILLARRHMVKKWLREGYFKLIRQEEVLEIDELHLLGLDILTIARLISAREAVLRNQWMPEPASHGGTFFGQPTRTTTSFRNDWIGISESVVYRILDSTFKQELEGMKDWD